MNRRARVTSEAALALHDPRLSSAEIAGRLVELVAELDLGKDAAFLPPGAQAPPADVDVVVLPLGRPADAAGSGSASGSGFGTLRCRPADPDAEELIALLAAHAGSALASLGHQAELRRVAERLQDLLLPPVPEVPHTVVEVRYRAAAREARVGGDFYDVFPLPDGMVLVAVGDVMGKGIEAAGRTSLITHTLRALALQDLDLDVLLHRLDEQVCYQDPQIMATVWCGLYDPRTGELDFASLGHPPALLLRTDAEPIHLTLQGLPLGMRDLSEDPPECRSRELHPRDLLVLYTDGLVEASGDYVSGQRALLEAVVHRRDEPLDMLVDHVMDELLAEAGHTDDAVMLALRRR